MNNNQKRFVWPNENYFVCIGVALMFVGTLQGMEQSPFSEDTKKKMLESFKQYHELANTQTSPNQNVLRGAYDLPSGLRDQFVTPARKKATIRIFSQQTPGGQQPQNNRIYFPTVIERRSLNLTHDGCQPINHLPEEKYVPRPLKYDGDDNGDDAEQYTGKDLKRRCIEAGPVKNQLDLIEEKHHALSNKEDTRAEEKRLYSVKGFPSLQEDRKIGIFLGHLLLFMINKRIECTKTELIERINNRFYDYDANLKGDHRITPLGTPLGTPDKILNMSKALEMFE